MVGSGGSQLYVNKVSFLPEEELNACLCLGDKSFELRASSFELWAVTVVIVLLLLLLWLVMVLKA